MKAVHVFGFVLMLIADAAIIPSPSEPDHGGCESVFLGQCVRCSDGYEFVDGVCVREESGEVSTNLTERNPCGQELYCGNTRRFSTEEELKAFIDKKIKMKKISWEEIFLLSLPINLAAASSGQ